MSAETNLQYMLYACKENTLTYVNLNAFLLHVFVNTQRLMRALVLYSKFSLIFCHLKYFLTTEARNKDQDLQTLVFH